MGQEYSFTAKMFLASAEAAWVFVALPTHVSDEIHDLAPRRPGFGSVRVAVRIGITEWKTSIFPSKELSTYVLPVKRSVRQQEQVDTGDSVDVEIRLIPD